METLQADQTAGCSSPYPMEVEGEVKNGAHWPLQPWRTPTVPGELLGWLHSLLDTVSLRFVVLKVVPYRRNLCAGFLCW